MSNLIDLTGRLAQSEETALMVPLIRLLVHGDPVTIEQLATATGLPVDDVRTRLTATPDTEYDDQGRIIGQGLTLRPTRHRFTVAGEEFYTWCALDTLVFPALLDRTVHVESTSPVSGEPVRLTVDPVAGVTRVEPSTAVVSLVNPEQIASIRPSFCNQVHYFTSPEDAQPWLREHPEAEVVDVSEAYRIGTTLTASLLDRADGGSPAGSADACC